MLGRHDEQRQMDGLANLEEQIVPSLSTLA
jgi:hypothetical protein